jgi:hypothetical protein
VKEIMVPVVKRMLPSKGRKAQNKLTESKSEDRVAKRMLKQYWLDPYDDAQHTEGMFDDFIHLCFQFGYVPL